MALLDDAQARDRMPILMSPFDPGFKSPADQGHPAQRHDESAGTNTGLCSKQPKASKNYSKNKLRQIKYLLSVDVTVERNSVRTAKMQRRQE